MLVLTRRQGESLKIGNDNKITVCIIYKTQVKLGIKAPESMKVDREEAVKENQRDIL